MSGADRNSPQPSAPQPTAPQPNAPPRNAPEPKGPGGARVGRASLLIVGAGPAGVSGALWARSLGLEATLIERAAQPGGQLRSIHFHPRQLPGFESGDGPELAAATARQLVAATVDVRLGVAARTLEAGGARPALILEDGARLEADAILIASGLERRRLGVPGERELEGLGVSHSATRDRDSFAGRDVLVAGGGDAAFENALLLADAGCGVTIVVRGEPRARAIFRERAAAQPRIRVLAGTRVTALIGEDGLRAARLETPEGVREQPFGGAVIKIGWSPAAAWCAAQVATDDQGFIRVDGGGRTSAPQVWAAGDVVHPPLFAIAVANASAAVAVADLARGLLP